MDRRTAIANADPFLLARTEVEPSRVSVWSHQDGRPGSEVVQALLRPHRTSFYFLLFVLEGTIQYSVDLAEVEVGAGEVLFVKPWQIRMPPETKGTAAYYKVTFGPEVLARMNARHRFWLDPFGECKVAFPGPTSRRVEATLESMRAAVRSAEPEVVWAYLNALSAEIEARYFAGPRHGEAGGLNEFLRFQELVDREYPAHPAVANLARSVGVSPSRLYELSKAWTGLSPKEYLNQRLVLEARRFLLHERLPVKELASRLGFSDENYFSRFYRRQTGESASEFQARHGDLSRRNPDSSPPRSAVVQ